MYPDEFDYYAADGVEHALELLNEHSMEDVELLSGGHSLLPAMKTGLSSPDVLIDVGGVDELRGVEMADGAVSVGASTRYSEFLDADGVDFHVPALADAVQHVGDKQVRNRGTIGGNLAHADPASDLPGAALAADATLVVRGPDGSRKVPVDDFFFGMYATDVGPGEILTRIDVPAAGVDEVGTYAKKPSPSSGYAMVGVAVRLALDGDAVASVRIGANGAMDHGVRLEAVEDALSGEQLDDETIAAAADRATEGLDVDMMMDDLQASNEFRAQLLSVYTERALRRAADRLAAPSAD